MIDFQTGRSSPRANIAAYVAYFDNSPSSEWVGCVRRVLSTPTSTQLALVGSLPARICVTYMNDTAEASVVDTR